MYNKNSIIYRVGARIKWDYTRKVFKREFNICLFNVLVISNSSINIMMIIWILFVVCLLYSLVSF